MSRYAQNGPDYVHVLLAERVLGRPLPTGAVVHHADGNPRNNTLSNFVICPDQAYQNLLHQRLRAMAATGDPAKRKCTLCKQWDDRSNLAERCRGARVGFIHRRCEAERKRRPQ